MTRIFIEQALSGRVEVSISGQELHYVSRVRRLSPGDEVELRDGEGRGFLARIREISRDAAILDITDETELEPDEFTVRLIVAVPKRNIFDDVVRKLSEIGVAQIQPVTTERSVVEPGVGRLDRWRRIAAESVRQCGRGKPVSVEDVVILERALREAPQGTRLILHPEGSKVSLAGALGDNAAAPITVAVGPEGGFTEEEIALAVELGFTPVGAGKLILRTETAAIVAAVVSVASTGGFE